MGNRLSLTCFKCNVINKISLDVIIDNNCYPIGDIGILRDRMDHLRALKRDVERQIDDCSEGEVRDVVKTWLRKVGELDSEVSEILAAPRCFLCSNKKLGTLLRITRAETLINQESDWKDSIFVKRCTTGNNSKDRIYIPPSSDAHIVGMDPLVDQVRKYLNNAEVGVVGIHGMGGAGKTTLAKKLIKELRSSSSSSSSSSSPSTSAADGHESRKFDNIIFATVSQNPDIAKLQKEIAVQLGIHRSSEFKDEEDESIRADFLRWHLSSRRFLLVLDDVWKKFDLKRIGIPELEEDVGNRIVLTTRESKVCTDMGASPENIVKVSCLGKEESWELFQKTIKWKEGKLKEKGVDEIAREIATAKCGGLPLVLKTIAGALATKEDRVSWENVRDQLQVSPEKIRGMSDVYRLLEVSYNNLEKEEYKSCLLYSALFPEDSDISIKTLVDYYIGGESPSVERYAKRSIDHLRNDVRYIVLELTEACLLERDKNEEHVKMHDAVRDMILNRIGRHDIGNDGGRKILSYEREYLLGTHDVDVEKWRAASMVSLSRNHIEELAMDPGKSTALCWGKVEKNGCQSNNLQVLLLDSGSIYARNSKFKLPTRLFEYFPSLRVLTLSRTNIEEIPASLCALESLRYLSMSFCRLLKALPKKMGKLKSLIQLDLSWTAGLSEIPTGLFSRLSKLQSLDLFGCDFFDNFHANRLQVLEEIGALLSLEDVGLSIAGDVRAVKLLVDYPHSLSNSITKLGVERVDLFKDDLFKTMGSRLKNLESLRIGSVRNKNIEQIVFDDGHFARLEELHIHYVDSFRHIIVKGRALQNLTHLKIFGCDEIEKLVEQPEGDGILRKLKSIQLTNCSNLLEISTSPLQLPSLKKLDLNCTSLKNISMIDSPHEVEIHCQEKWWEELEWNNSERAPPINFKPIFKVQVSTPGRSQGV